MRETFLHRADDATLLLYNEKLFPEIYVHKDSMYKELFRLQNTELDALTVEALEIMMHHFACVLGRQLHDQLPGGSFSSPSDELLAEARHVPKTNRFGESVFGVLDGLMIERPGATTLNLESTIMYNMNKTDEWIASLPSTEKADTIQQARLMASATIEKYKSRKQLRTVLRPSWHAKPTTTGS